MQSALVIGSTPSYTPYVGQEGNLTLDTLGRLRVAADITGGSGGGVAQGLVVSGDQSYAVGSTQTLNLTTTGRLKVGLSSAGPAAPGTAASFADLAAGIYVAAGISLNDGQQAAIQLDAVGRQIITQPDGGAITPIPASGTASATSASVIFSIDTSGYNGLGIQVTSAGSGNTVVFEVSDDNATWSAATVYTNTGGAVTSVASIITVAAPLSHRYFRARISTYSSGTVTTLYTLRRTYAASTLPGSIGGSAPSDGLSTGILGMATTTFNMLFNGTSWDRQRNNFESAALVTLSAQAAGTVTSPDQTNYNGRGATISISITGATSMTLTVTLQGKDPVSGNYYNILSSTALNTTGFTTLTAYPGIAAAANAAASAVLPRTWRISAAVTGTAVTATIAASIIV